MQGEERRGNGGKKLGHKDQEEKNVDENDQLTEI